ncbi:hypothetical protein BKA65DRAFT_481779 [Rhexocercosporidium sp. MPI-PUGE-AT-0058]|nr:hypothetical protein BKA65DRAFT_481779 [Rhexocercosporidium sp. MPI-PUGE-AT-0058]
MDSGNWRIKREPQGSSAKTPRGKQRASFQARSSWGQGQQSSPIQQSLPSRDGLRKSMGESQDIEMLFQDVAPMIEGINISVDAMTGRNPSYCFVDFRTREMAGAVMQEDNGREFLRRNLKVKPGVKSERNANRSTSSSESRSEGSQLTFDCWNRLETPGDLNLAANEGRRLYVGGLPRFENQVDTNQQTKELFKDYNVQVISKPISAHESKKDLPGNHNYCFVDLATPEEAASAATALDNLPRWNWKIKVSVTRGTSGKMSERRKLFVEGLPEFPDQETTDLKIQELFEGFEISTISKLKTPQDMGDGKKRNSFCFVELANASDADRALLELDWKEKWGIQVRVKPATSSNIPGQKAETRKPADSGGSRVTFVQ